MRAYVCVCVSVHARACVGMGGFMGACRGVYVCLCFGCGPCASVVPGKGCMCVCVCALHLLCVVGVAYVICGFACIEHAHASVPHECPKVLCVRM